MAAALLVHALVHMLLRAFDQRDRKWPTGGGVRGGYTGAGGLLKRGGVAV